MEHYFFGGEGVGGWDIPKNYIHCIEKQNQARGVMGTKDQARAIYCPGPVFDFLSFLSQKIVHKIKMRTYFMLEKIITPTPPSKNKGPSLSTQRWSLYEGFHFGSW